MSIETHELVGWYFVTTNKEGVIKYQGVVESQVDELGYFMVRFFSWVDGSPTAARLVHIDEMKLHFTFTGKTIEMHDDYNERFLDLRKPKNARINLPWEPEEGAEKEFKL